MWFVLGRLGCVQMALRASWELVCEIILAGCDHDAG
jgi:hypothetical protein